MASTRRSLNAGGENPEFVQRHFGGMSNNAAREAINDDDFYWLENAIPLADGNIQPVGQPSAAIATLSGEANPATFSCTFSISGINYVFAAFGFTGNGYIVNLNTAVVTQIFTGTLSVNSTFAVPYNNQGVLIIDPSGYFDWSVTTANTLTNWNKSLTGGTITQSQSVAGGVTLTNDGLTPGTGGSIQTYYQVISATISAAGTGYVVGDTLSLTDGAAGSAGVSGTQFQTQIVVASIGGGGAITGITLANAGSYAGPVTGSSLALPSGTVVSGGTGTGATFTIAMKAIANSTFVISPGTGYTASTVTHDKNGATVVTTVSITTSGIIGGTCLATYAGRVWIANNRTVYVTNVGSYNNFGLAGTSFTITDSYLHNVITCLYAANNYLYIFGDSSIDALSNVVVSSGVTSFSRINIVIGIGTTQPQSVFSYFRAVCFFHASGIYLLSGASPEKISEKISGVVRAVNNQLTVVAAGCTVTVAGELCVAMQFNTLDTFSTVGGFRTLVFLFFRGRWWVASFASMFNGFAGGIVSVPSGRGVSGSQGVLQMFFWGLAGGHAALYQAFSSATLSSWILRTKLWDGNAPLKEKQSLTAALQGFTQGLASSGVNFQIDTESKQTTAAAFPVNTAFTGETLMVSQGNIGGGQGRDDGGQYLGLTLKGDGTNLSQVNLVALRGLTERDMLQ